MKKLAFFLACLMVVSILPIPAYAAERLQQSDSIQITTKKSLDDLVISAFPEYESKIRGENQNEISVTSISSSAMDVVVCETRKLSDEVEVTYVEYSNGVVISFLSENVVVRSSSTTGSMNIYTVDIYASCNYSDGMVEVSDFQYALCMNTSYDAILSRGDLQHLGSVAPLEGNYKMSEDANGPAYAEYCFTFIACLTGVDAPTEMYFNVYGVLRAEVGSDTFSSEITNEIITY